MVAVCPRRSTARVELVGADPADRDPATGLWPSDHAGVLAEVERRCGLPGTTLVAFGVLGDQALARRTGAPMLAAAAPPWPGGTARSPPASAPRCPIRHR